MHSPRPVPPCLKNQKDIRTKSLYIKFLNLSMDFFQIRSLSIFAIDQFIKIWSCLNYLRPSCWRISLLKALKHRFPFAWINSCRSWKINWYKLPWNTTVSLCNTYNSYFSKSKESYHSLCHQLQTKESFCCLSCWPSSYGFHVASTLTLVQTVISSDREKTSQNQ